MTNPSPYRVQHRLGRDFSLWKNGRPTLGKLDIELTERCNNRCIHCYINQDAADRDLEAREVGLERLKEIVTEAAELGCLTIKYTGGEPLLRPDFSDLYVHTKRSGILVTLCTNATLISEQLARTFQHYPLGNPIEVTLYGMSPESYAKVSGMADHYRLAMRGIGLLIDYRIPFVIKGIRTPWNEGEIDEMERFAAAHCTGGMLPPVSMNFNLRARRDNERKNQVIRSLRATREETIAALGRHEREYRDTTQQFAARFMGPSGDRLFSCGCGCGGTLDAYGMLQPCLLLRHPEVVYDLRNGTLRDALQRFFPIVREMRATNPDYVRRCARCLLHGFCEQCPAHSWMEHGTLDTPVEYLCEIAHAQARHLELLGNDEYGWDIADPRGRINSFINQGTKSQTTTEKP